MSAFDNVDVKNKDEQFVYKTQSKKIGGTTYTIVSHYHGTSTYEDVVKSILKQEVDKENA